MLHKDSFIIAPSTFLLIQELQAIPAFSNFYLVGGTSLALQLGHRNSIDIDLFSLNEFDENEVLEILNKQYEVSEIFRRRNTIICLLNNIKTDFIRHNYPLLKPPVTEERIAFLSKEDIAAMKLHAIIQSGKRLKDFIDIYFLLQHFNMQQMIEFFTAKYQYSNPMIAMKAVTFFDEIDENTEPPKLLKPLPIAEIKKRILTAAQKPTLIFK
jgi:Nucleotidyl transferase AbiEii toxin, Type IV TA system